MEGSGCQTVDTRSILGIWVMWKVGGIKIESKQACNIFVRHYTKLDEKENFLVQRSVHENFPWEIFLGVVSTERLRTQNTVHSNSVYSNVLALGDQASVSNL